MLAHSIAAICAWIWLLHSAHAADVLSNPPFLYILGTINEGDPRLVEDILNRPEQRTAITYINSDEGHLLAAMAIGRLMRKHEMMVNVDRASRCASACIFILAGAVNRAVEGPLIIHRPYLMQSLSNNSNYDEFYKRTELLVRSYLSEMNIPASLADDMMSVPPNRGVPLSAAQIERYLLNDMDPAFEQKLAAADAQKLGISLTEHRRRQSKADVVCGWPYSDEESFFEFISHSACRDAIMQGRPHELVLQVVHSILRRRSQIEALSTTKQGSCVRTLFLGEQNADCPKLGSQ